MTSDGNRNPANAETGDWMGRLRGRRFTPTASPVNGPGTSPTDRGAIALNATVPPVETPLPNRRWPLPEHFGIIPRMPWPVFPQVRASSRPEHGAATPVANGQRVPGQTVVTSVA